MPGVLFDARVDVVEHRLHRGSAAQLPQRDRPPRLRPAAGGRPPQAHDLPHSPTPFGTPSFVSVDSPRGDGEYTIRKWWGGPALAQVSTPAQAIAIAVDRIPSRLLQQSPNVAPED
ncbi:DUF6193 family natural product biosynthesis protein [Spirillospora sp. CA-142024]|uniref:DUF6193 family natural product biosynthesis protein n=1 Tax=Spirillospora sp. CA-142024 TaxID=3240036 RepID=UPI003D928FEC